MVVVGTLLLHTLGVSNLVLVEVVVAVVVVAVTADRQGCMKSVSYTHLTLPTNREV